MATGVPQPSQATEVAGSNQHGYRTLLDLVPVAVYSCDSAGVIQDFNRRAAALWGCEPVRGDTAESFCGSFKLYRPDGTFMPQDHCPMAEVVAGTLDGIITSWNAGAEEANRAKDQFLATVSHELRTPLNAIRGWATILEQSGPADTRMAKGLQSIGRNTRTLVQLVDDLLDVSRMISGKMRLDTRRDPAAPSAVRGGRRPATVPRRSRGEGIAGGASTRWPADSDRG